MKYLLILLSIFVSVGCNSFNTYPQEKSYEPINAEESLIKEIDGKITMTSGIISCATLMKGGSYKLDSVGGNILSSLAVARCMYDRDISLEVKNAASAAPLLIFAAKRVCFHSTALILFHKPSTKAYYAAGIDMPYEERLHYYTAMEDTMLAIGIKSPVIVKYLSFWEKSSNHKNHNQMTSIPHSTLIEMLGDKFEGYCK